MKKTTTPIIDSAPDGFLHIEDIIAMWPITPLPSRDQILRWSKAGSFVSHFRGANQKDVPLFEKDAVIGWLEHRYAPVYAKRRAKQKGGRDV